MHPELKRRVPMAIEALRQAPSTGKPLVEELVGWRSLRVGRLRILYREAGRVIEIGVIGPRATVYLDAARRIGGRYQRTASSTSATPRSAGRGWMSSRLVRHAPDPRGTTGDPARRQAVTGALRWRAEPHGGPGEPRAWSKRPRRRDAA